VARAPWQRWPVRAALALPPLTLTLIALGNAVDPQPYNYAVFFVVVHVWVGMALPRWTSLWLAPVTALAYCLPFLLMPDGASSVLTALIVVPLCVLVAETVAWLMHQIATKLLRREVEDSLDRERQARETVPTAGQRVELLPCGNLGVGGDVRVVTDLLHPKLRALAIRAVGDMGLRLASVDLVLSQPSDAPPKRCTVLEVNSAPGVDTHEREPGWSRRRVERVCRILLALDRDL